MNLLSFRIVNRFIKVCLNSYILLGLSTMAFSWDIDFSRRASEINTKSNDTLAWPSTQISDGEFFSESPLKKILTSFDVGQVISILQTEEGFVPSTLRLRKDISYKIYIVNVNEKFKNASFILDSFGQSFGTYFGKYKNFDLNPKVDGTFTFFSPETGAQGKIIVFSDKDSSSPLAVSQSEVKK